MKTSVIIPAFNEGESIEKTLQALYEEDWIEEIIGVNDGSKDETGKVMEKYCDQVIHFKKNTGKSAALQAGWEYSKGDIIMCLDGDLRGSAVFSQRLYTSLLENDSDMVIANVPAGKQSGRGIFKKRVQAQIYKKTGRHIQYPLSGQRAFKRAHLPLFQSLRSTGFGIETVMTLQALNNGLQILEIELPFTHKEYGKAVKGSWHRGKQWLEVERCLWNYGKQH
ncbi:glycosyltransferase family 2 protein [Bacillus sp. FJAT-44742]|uniref:glycosyltransferase family 2 protein n=1 Tax=Bacillus sp. FJAT-44742 TaxID=2014005 RepID=UPI000C232F1D|nr:glycosyltransferase family 2 protein [Bacillus sp. FJAT-44742]